MNTLLFIGFPQYKCRLYVNLCYLDHNRQKSLPPHTFHFAEFPLTPLIKTPLVIQDQKVRTCWLKSFPTVMIVIWGFHNFLICLAYNFFIIFKLSNLIIHLVHTQNFPKNERFLPPGTHIYVCVSGSKEC